MLFVLIFFLFLNFFLIYKGIGHHFRREVVQNCDRTWYSGDLTLVYFIALLLEEQSAFSNLLHKGSSMGKKTKTGKSRYHVSFCLRIFYMEIRCYHQSHHNFMKCILYGKFVFSYFIQTSCFLVCSLCLYCPLVLVHNFFSSFFVIIVMNNYHSFLWNWCRRDKYYHLAKESGLYSFYWDLFQTFHNDVFHYPIHETHSHTMMISKVFVHDLLLNLFNWIDDLTSSMVPVFGTVVFIRHFVNIYFVIIRFLGQVIHSLTI